MRIAAKEFNVAKGERPKVLFLGNGICRAYSGESWNNFLDEIKDKKKFPEKAENYELPMPLKAAMLADGKLAERMREQRKNKFDSFACCTSDLQVAINRLADLGFDYILTTNYSYEIEAALMNKSPLNENDIKKLMTTTGVDNPQTKYLINTFNLTGNNQVWHIHGEIRKPDSMIICQYYYGNLLFYYKNYFDKNEPRYKKLMNKNEPVEFNSWLDAFIFGDVYFMGFGLDFSETDLWWLLERKYNTESHGRTVFFNPIKNRKPREKGNIPEDACKQYLLNTYEVTSKNFNFEINCNEDYKDFYEKVYVYLRRTTHE